ncbi:hypothetical protein J4231_03575 [Candidatus Woesearchaeota archaeon]|nr:hypothetical protein [Candidatus Woesearchaeota archaeon]
MKDLDKSLIAMVEPLKEYSLVETAKCLKRFVSCQDEMHAAVIELKPDLIGIVSGVISAKGYSFEFFDIGHISILLSYLHDKRNMDIHYCQLSGLENLLVDVKLSMERNKQTGLYQICDDEHRNEVERILTESGYRILPNQR